MDFEDFKRIYDKRKASSEGFDFVKDIFKEVREEYEKQARAKGKDPNQSWNSWSGRAFQRLVTFTIEDFLRDSHYPVGITGDGQLRKEHLPDDLEQVKRNILVFYSNFGVVPDADIILYDKESLKVIAVLSCKASLRERIAQAGYWKIKLQSLTTTHSILCYLISTDNDEDFVRIGKDISRDRIIVEYGELDGAYILRDVPESTKVKNYQHLFGDLDQIFKKWFKAPRPKK